MGEKEENSGCSNNSNTKDFHMTKEFHYFIRSLINKKINWLSFYI